MDLLWNDKRTRQFVTNVGLITTDGPLGRNIVAAEWTHHISYSPSLIAVNIRGHDATTENIRESENNYCIRFVKYTISSLIILPCC